MDREKLHKSFRSVIAQVGGVPEYARLVSKSRQAIWQLLNRGSIMPADHVIRAEHATGVDRSVLRPDLYPPE
jgi:DNA-binding transcriptional regulator YdaS (Cro superfamily)